MRYHNNKMSPNSRNILTEICVFVAAVLIVTTSVRAADVMPGISTRQSNHLPGTRNAHQLTVGLLGFGDQRPSLITTLVRIMSA